MHAVCSARARRVQISGKTAASKDFVAKVRRGEAGCLAPGALEVPATVFVARAEAEGEDVLAPPDDGDGEALQHSSTAIAPLLAAA